MRVLTIGRKGTDIVLPDTYHEISRLHAELTVTDQGGCYLVDCGSSNGTSVRRQSVWQRIKQDYVTKDEPIRFGDHYTTTVRELIDRAPT